MTFPQTHPGSSAQDFSQDLSGHKVDGSNAQSLGGEGPRGQRSYAWQGPCNVSQGLSRPEVASRTIGF